MVNEQFWAGKKVLITGHTGFKGSWLGLWLTQLGARVTGYALQPPTEPSLFELGKINTMVNSLLGDVRDLDTLIKIFDQVKPEIVIHLAAQPLVRDSYKNPVETYAINVMGTVNVLEAIRQCDSVRAVVNVTTDKCYENKEWLWGYRETEPLGGYDPYSNSKACSELVTAAYRNSFFNPQDYQVHGVAVASARAGNVIGGGDWATDRLIPDFFRAVAQQETVVIRNPSAIRPWQHVLEPLHGYLLLAEKLYTEGPAYAEAWNFGPAETDAKTVGWIINKLCKEWGPGAACAVDKTGNQPHEATYLKLDSSKARLRLGWKPRWNIEQALQKIIEWYKAYEQGNGNPTALCRQQIQEYITAVRYEHE